MLLTIILPLVAFGVFAAAVLANTMLRRLRRTSEELAEREAQARHEAKHDALSGLPNRVHMVEKIDDFLQGRLLATHDNRASPPISTSTASRTSTTRWGTTPATNCEACGAAFEGLSEAGDFLARFGGDEFVILSRRPEWKRARRLPSALRSLRLPFPIDGQDIRVTASVGIAVAPDNGITADELMRHADIALYEAKERGRDRRCSFPTKWQQVEHRRQSNLICGPR